MKVYTIIITYNGMQWIDSCLSSIINQSEVIVVDNNSSDDTVSFIEKNYKNVILLKQLQNFGFGKANNIGMSYALKNNADYVFLINQDVYVDTNVVSDLLSISNFQSDYGVISPMHFNGKGKQLDRYFEFCASKNKHFKKNILNKNSSQLYNVPMVNGAAWFMPVKVLNEVGGFDPIFYHYGEDHNYCQRLLYHGYKIGIASNIKIRHDREHREKSSILQFSDAYYQKYEKQMKVNYADINLNLSKDVCKGQKIKYLKLMLKSILQLKLKIFFGYLKQYRFIHLIFQSIYTSRSINRKKGNHYIVY